MSIATLTIDIVAKLASIERDLGRATQITERNAARMENAFKKVTRTIQGLVGGATVGAFVKMITNTAKAAEEIETLSRISSSGVEEFQKYAFAAASVGIEQQKLGDIFKDFREKVGEFVQTGGGGMKDFFEQIAPQIGITADAFRDLSGPQALQLYFDSLEKANLSQEQMSFYLESMASDTTALIPLLQDGGEGFKKLGDEAQRAGGIMDQEAVSAAREFNRNLKELQATMDGLRVQIAGPVIRALNDFSRELKNAGDAGVALSRVNLGVLNTPIQAATVFAGNLSFVLKGIGTEIGGIAAQFGRLVELDFAGARAIGQMMREDAQERRRQFDEWERAIMNPTPTALPPGAESPTQTSNPFQTPTRPERPTKQTRPKISEEERQFEAIQKQIEALRQQAEAFGLSEKQAALYQLRIQGANDAQLESAAIILREIDILRERAGLQEQAKQIYEQTRTPIEVLNIELGNLNTLLQSGSLDWDTYARAVFAAQDRFDGLAEKAEETSDKIDTFADQAARNIQSSFANFLFNPFEDGLRGMLLNFSDTLRRMASELIASKLLNMLGGSLAGSGGPLGAFGASLLKVSGARASGGPVSGGSTYLVGERGPELFVPRQSGSIVPNNQMGAMQATPQNIRIVNTIDPAFVGDFMTSAEGERVIMNVVKRNASTMRQVVA